MALRGVRTSGPMAPEISLANQRPAQYIFSQEVQKRLSEIRKAKSTAQLPMRAEVARAVVRDSGDRLELLGEVEDDVADAGRVARFEKVADGAFSVEVEFASGG